jgi:ankyrin repeat protein
MADMEPAPEAAGEAGEATAVAGAAAPGGELAEELADCARYGEEEEVKQLIATAAASSDIAAVVDLVNTPASSGNTALHMAAANGHVEICACLLEAGAATDTKNGSGNTPLHWAALNGHLAAVSLLLERGADCGSKCRQLAQRQGHTAVVAMLDEWKRRRGSQEL